MTNRLLPQNACIPWIASFEFSSHADAKTFAALVEEQFGDKATVRKKNVVYQQGAFAGWRTTRAVREALSGRSFTCEMVAESLSNAGYAGSRNSSFSWLLRAVKEGVIVRLERGLYEFPRHLPAGTAVSAPDPDLLALEALMCQGCKPEALQCP